MFTVDITDFLARECMRDYSASVAEIGPDAGRYTWDACTENAPEWNFIPADMLDYFRDWVGSSGGWERAEIDAWPPEYLQALCLQWIASDTRNCGADNPAADWDDIRACQESGQAPNSIYRDESGRVFWECAQ